MSFRVVLSGRALPGYTPEQIAQHLQTQLKFSDAQVKALLPPHLLVRHLQRLLRFCA